MITYKERILSFLLATLICFSILFLCLPAQADIISIASQEIGNGEQGKNNYGKDIARYGVEGQPWCASFVSYVLKEAGIDFPTSNSAREIFNRGVKLGLQVNEPKAGDLICFWRGKKSGWQGHIGIVKSVGETITTIEGNRGSYPAKVSEFNYKGEVPKLLGYIRLDSK